MDEQPRGPWHQVDALVARFSAELEGVTVVCRRLKWTLRDPRKLHGLRWIARKAPQGPVVRATTAQELLLLVERAEVTRRAVRIEREVTLQQLEAAGYTLKDPRSGVWAASHRGSGHLLEAQSAAELREKLRAHTQSRPLDEVAALPLLNPDEAEEVDGVF